ncbi:MAG TPA: capsule assembly Wzi family protein [Planctomycetota bacterium]|nr:capsule assembly Wzi family protein [Planctomycetota bacterium]
MGPRSGGVWSWAAVGCLALVLSASAARAEPDVPLDSWVYGVLDRLQAAGLVQSGSLNTRPISRREAARMTVEARRIAAEKGERRFDRLIEHLEREFETEIAGVADGTRSAYVKPVDELRGGGLWLDGPDRVYNDNGREHHEGGNGRADVSSRFSWGPVSGALRAEGRLLPADDEERQESGGALAEGYLKLNAGKWFLLAGREPLWWGPGRHGSLLLSTNARPLDLVRVGNDEPVLLPWVFSRVGPLRVESFVARLDDESQPFPNPYFAGARISVIPLPWVELGASRVAMFGGRGRTVDGHTIDSLITGRGENDPNSVGNQEASLDLRLTLPLDIQPVQFYGELGGEDMAGGFFSREAVLAGVFLPRLGPWEQFDLRLEYADTWLGGHGNNDRVWYQHGDYPMTCDGRVIGHHAGTDARDAYAELGWSPVPELRLWAAADFERHGLAEDHPEQQRELKAGAQWWLTERLSLEASCSRVEVDNAGFVEGEESKSTWVSLSAGWRF